MSNLIPMIATLLVALAAGRLTAQPTLRRLRQQLADATWRLAHDPLTGLLNRAGLSAAHAAIKAEPKPILIILIDLDNFKDVNDSYGHDAGDHLLVTVAHRIDETATHHGGVAARLAGDEFTAILPVRHHDITRIAELFLAMIAAPVPLTLDAQHITVTPTASIGVSWAEATDPLEEVGLRRADIAMYHAKRNGRNRHAVYEPGMAIPAHPARRGPRLRDRSHLHNEVTAR